MRTAPVLSCAAEDAGGALALRFDGAAPDVDADVAGAGKEIGEHAVGADAPGDDGGALRQDIEIVAARPAPAPAVNGGSMVAIRPDGTARHAHGQEAHAGVQRMDGVGVDAVRLDVGVLDVDIEAAPSAMHADDAVGSEAVRVEVAARYADADIAGPPVQGVDAVGIIFGRVDIDAGSVDIQLSAAFALAIDAVKVGLPDADRAAVHIDIDTARRAEMNARDAVMRLAAGVDVEIVEVDADILFGGRILLAQHPVPGGRVARRVGAHGLLLREGWPGA